MLEGERNDEAPTPRSTVEVFEFAIWKETPRSTGSLRRPSVWAVDVEQYGYHRGLENLRYVDVRNRRVKIELVEVRWSARLVRASQDAAVGLPKSWSIEGSPHSE